MSRRLQRHPEYNPVKSDNNIMLAFKKIPAAPFGWWDSATGLSLKSEHKRREPQSHEHDRMIVLLLHLAIVC